MTIVMNMSSYEIERAEEVVETYGDEVMYAGWNPQLAQTEVAHIAPAHAAFPPSLADVDVEGFLRKMYANQR
ncbi:MAG: hypothetical protein PHH36_02535 [Sideroxydans sp.]|nr:hypothetical protein [Sideroxydans sp.]